jgi:hypothetical protein
LSYQGEYGICRVAEPRTEDVATESNYQNDERYQRNEHIERDRPSHKEDIVLNKFFPELTGKPKDVVPRPMIPRSGMIGCPSVGS